MPRLTTRDYKRPSRSASAGRLKEFGFGVLVGVVLTSAAFLLAGARARHGAAADWRHFAGGAPHAPAPEEGPAGAASEAAAHDGAAAPGSASAQGGAPAPQYDFYRMLPSFKVPVPRDEQHPANVPAPVAAREAVHPVPAGAAYLLQVGSYRSSAEADQVRAHLARVGLSAQVQRIVAGSTTWHRVRIGPLTDAELARVREQLRHANIHALVIRVDR